MGGYARTGPFVNGSSPGISATFLNNVEAVLARPSGDTETGCYGIDTSSYSSPAHFGEYVSTISRTSVPVSVSVDTSIILFNSGGVSTNHLTANGFGVDGTSNATSLSTQAFGNYTVSY